MNKILLSILIFASIIGCSKKIDNNEEYNTLSININDSEKFIEKDFFDLFSVDTLIELEFKDDFYIAELFRLKKGNDEYYALDPLIGNLIRYSNSGKVLNRIGLIGPGPMEMNEIEDFSYDKERDELLLSSYSAMKISRFKPNGNFISSVKLREQLDQFSYSDDRLAVSMTYFNSLYKSFALLNNTGDTLKTFFPYPKNLSPISLKYVSGHVTNSIHGGFLFNEPASSTIYGINSNGDFFPKYEFIGGNDFWPNSKRHLVTDFFQTLAAGEVSYLTRFYEESENYFIFNLNIKKSNSRPQIIDPRIGYYSFVKKVVYYSKYYEGLLWIKGPMEVENDMFYCYVSKFNLNKLGENQSIWSKVIDSYPHLRINYVSDLDTPVLVRFKINV